MIVAFVAVVLDALGKFGEPLRELGVVLCFAPSNLNSYASFVLYRLQFASII